MWRNLITKFLLAAIAAEAAGVFAILIATQDFETAGLGLLVPLFLIPSMVLHLFARSVASLMKGADWFYWLPACGLAVAFAYAWLAGGEGSGFAGYMAMVLVVASIAAYAMLRFQRHH